MRQLLRILGVLSAFGLTGVALAVTEGLYGQAAYLGGLAFAAALFMLFAGIIIATPPTPRIVPVKDFAWGTGATTAAFVIIAFVLSRTTGLVRYHRDNWSVIGVLMIAFAAVHVLAYVGSLWLGGTAGLFGSRSLADATGRAPDHEELTATGRLQARPGRRGATIAVSALGVVLLTVLGVLTLMGVTLGR